ncbi:MAG: ABC transporter permease [Candidatus Aenigmarchaeota archaeon]|nr:ABC transporter permease [Candidatus Aenigmarchaeota archaeon]
MLDLAVKDLKEHKVRTVLTTLGVIIAITAIVSLGSISAGINDMVSEGISMVGSDIIFVMKSFDMSEMSGPPTSMQLESIKEDEIQEISGIFGVKRVVPIISKMMGGFFGEIDGIDMNELDIWGASDIQFKEGYWPDNDDEGIAIGYPISQFFDVGIGDYIVLNKKDVEVYGIFEESSGAYDMAAILPYSYAEDIYDMEGEATMLVVEPEDISMVEDIKNAIEEDYDDLDAMTMADAMAMAQEMTATLNIMTFGIGGVASLVAAIGIIITMYTSVLERRREIGILKAVGAVRWVVLKQILEESIIMSLFGSLVGVGISFFFVDMLNNVLLGGSNLALITPALAIGAVSYGVIITVIFSLYPAWIAVKTDPIDAIRNG